MIRLPIAAEDFRRVWLLLCAALLVGMAGAAGAEQPGPDAEPWNLTLFHTNDSHSAFLPRPAHWRDDRKMVGGVVPLAWHLADQRRTTAHDLLLDAGDFMTGNPVCLLEENGVPGVAVARMMNALGYDAGVIGNHEFDVGSDKAAQLAPLFDYPLFGGDIVDAQGQPAYRREPLIVTRGDLRIGIFGFSCAGMAEVVTPAKLGGLRMAEQASLARELAAKLDPQTDLIILITHNGVDGDKALAAELTGAGIDIIVGGHSHTRLKQPIRTNDILIVQAGSKMTNLGRLDLEVAGDRVVNYSGQLIDLWSDGTYADNALNRLVARYEHEVMEQYGRQIGTLATDLRKGRGEHNLGNWLADCLRARADADVAVINSGGIRKPLNAGPITALDITEMLPFANNLVRMKLSGAQLAAVVQQNANAGVSGKHGILQVSGLRYIYRPAADGETAEVTEIIVGREALDPERDYIVAMPDFVAMMNDVYLQIDLPEVDDLGLTLAAAVTAQVLEAGTVSAEIEGRIMRLE
jgi:2',3'-cyclic-nucleotide 2'-phosphodiesterase (5'-nucleotidase family)